MRVPGAAFASRDGSDTRDWRGIERTVGEPDVSVRLFLSKRGCYLTSSSSSKRV